MYISSMEKQANVLECYWLENVYMGAHGYNSTINWIIQESNKRQLSVLYDGNYFETSEFRNADI